MSPASSIAVFAFAVSAWLPHVRADEHRFELLQQHAQVAAKVHEAALVANAGLGSMAPISEKGYQTVAALKSDKEMVAFMKRVVEAEARSVSSDGDLYGMAPYYSGTTAVQSLDGMKKELRESPWVADGEGRIAPLTEDGYQRVARLRSRAQMTAFIRRILDARNLQVVRQDGLSGLTPYYDGEMAVQNFERLSQEVLSATWVEQRGAKKLESSDGTVAAISESKGSIIKEDPVETTAFNDFDLDGDGFISRAELKSGMGKFEREFSDSDIENMLVEADTDGDGQISLEEFKAKMQD